MATGILLTCSPYILFFWTKPRTLKRVFVQMTGLKQSGALLGHPGTCCGVYQGSHDTELEASLQTPLQKAGYGCVPPARGTFFILAWRLSKWVPWPAAAAPPANLQKCRFSGPTPGLLSQKPEVELISPSFNKPSREFCARPKSENPVLGRTGRTICRAQCKTKMWGLFSNY